MRNSGNSQISLKLTSSLASALLFPSLLVEWCSPRGDDKDAMIGGAVMFDIDKIFTVGGVQNYDLAGEPSSPRAYVIDISSPDDPEGPTVERLPDMAWGRASLNVVALPNGMVVVVGGQTNTRPFSDDFAVLSVEMYDPSSKSWFEFSQPLTTARNYHSASLLMKDGRIVVGGGGLCSSGCDIYTTWVRASECLVE
jgi:galactose oxidase